MEKIKEFTSDICVRCTKIQKNCCNDNSLIPLTTLDIKKIEKLGHKKEDFLIVKNYPNSWLVGNEKWWRTGCIKYKGKNLKLNVRKIDRVCYFLDCKKGCKLGKDRPDVCKIYPFWIDKKGKIIYEPGEENFCYMSKLKLSPEKAMKLTRENPDKIKKYYNNIKEDCIKNNKPRKKIILELLKKLRINF